MELLCFQSGWELFAYFVTLRVWDLDMIPSTGFLGIWEGWSKMKIFTKLTIDPADDWSWGCETAEFGIVQGLIVGADTTGNKAKPPAVAFTLAYVDN
jgi:hypothetical protein